jgi:mycofactocin system glycosyltransferase
MTVTLDQPFDPAGRLEPADDLQVADQHRLLIGGSPLAIVRLSSSGAALVRAWFGGAPIGAAAAHQRLARRLQANGMAHLEVPAPSPRPACTVVIPVHDDHDELRRTIAALRGGTESPARPGPMPIIVVDDGSARPVESPGPDVLVIRRNRPGGPGVARQQALAMVDTPVVVFLDAGVTAAPTVVERLVDALADEAVVAAAPRVRSVADGTLVGRYDQHRSPLDLGSGKSIVGPGRAVPYVPTACLAVRTAAVHDVGGFDPGLRYGEDVDLVWRMGQRGLVRYLPSLTVEHPPRRSVAAMVTQRVAYASSAAALAERHGSDTVSPCRVSAWSLPVIGLGLVGRPLSAAAVAAGTGLAVRSSLAPMPDRTVRAVGLTARGHWYGGLSIAIASLRAWVPPVVGLLVAGGPARRPVGLLVAAGVGRRLLDGPRRPADALVDLGMGVVDDVASCAGLWAGAVRHRSPAALRPATVRWSAGQGQSSGDRRAGALGALRSYWARNRSSS